MAEETHYAANTGKAVLTTANTNLDGTGTLFTILTGAANGTLIKSVWIKSSITTLQGMVRLFIYDGTNTRLIQEVEVPAITPASYNPAFEAKVDLNLSLKSGYILKGSTALTANFNVFAEGLDWSYYAAGVRTDTTEYTANTNAGAVSVANSNLDGTGTLVLIYTAGSATSFSGSSIKSITIESEVESVAAPGMIRIFITDNVGSKMLFREVYNPASGQAANTAGFAHTIVFDNDFDMKPGWSLYASTEIAQTFTITVEGCDWTYLG